MFSKKKKTEEVFTPLDLDKLSSQADGWVNHTGTREEAAQLEKDKKTIRIIRWILLAIIIIVVIIWLLSYCATQFGDLVVTVDNELVKQGIMISESEDFEEPKVMLSGENANEVYHYTYDWFADQGVLKDLDNIDGSHNGDDYFAYTFYVKNTGKEVQQYNASLVVTGVSKSCDEAARVMVYKNGEPNIYAKLNMKTNKAETDATAFVDDTTVYQTSTADFGPDAVDKYTVVIWFEGKDSECIDDIRGGHMRLSMLFEAAEQGDAQ